MRCIALRLLSSSISQPSKPARRATLTGVLALFATHALAQVQASDATTNPPRTATLPEAVVYGSKGVTLFSAPRSSIPAQAVAFLQGSDTRSKVGERSRDPRGVVTNRGLAPVERG